MLLSRRNVGLGNPDTNTYLQCLTLRATKPPRGAYIFSKKNNMTAQRIHTSI